MAKDNPMPMKGIMYWRRGHLQYKDALSTKPATRSEALAQEMIHILMRGCNVQPFEIPVVAMRGDAR